MTLSELGTTLQTEREKRGLTLQDVAERLRISMHVLRALEMGDVDALPHKAYAKGFIRSYATLLGLATDEIEACVASLSGASPSVPQPIATPVTVGDDSKGESVTVPTGKILACAIVLLVLAGGGYAVSHFGLLDLVPSVEQVRTAIPLLADSGKTDADSAQKPAAKTQSAPAATAPSAPKAVNDGKQSAATKSAPEQAAPNKAAARQNAPAQNASGQNTAGQDTSGQAASAQATSGQTAPGQTASGQIGASAKPAPAATSGQPAANMPRHHKIIVTATEDCWIHSNADKTNTRQFTLRKGDTFALTFARTLEVKLGNAAGVRIRYNGNELPPAGKRGETRTLVFPPAEQQ